jgi:hypothetical protein
LYIDKPRFHGPGPRSDPAQFIARYNVRRAYLDGLPVASERVPIKKAGGQAERTGPVRTVRRALAI